MLQRIFRTRAAGEVAAPVADLAADRGDPDLQAVMCAIGLPAVAGALSNVRSIREFSRHPFRYARMAAVLRRYTGVLDDEPDIRDLGKLAVEVGGLLTAETRNWLGEVSGRGLEIPG
jgi:hypothetical protein